MDVTVRVRGTVNSCHSPVSVADTSATKESSLSASTLETWKQHEHDYIQSARDHVSSVYNKSSYQPTKGMSPSSIVSATVFDKLTSRDIIQSNMAIWVDTKE